MNTEDRFIITGLAGAQTLKGTIHIHGAKNAALKAMAASVLFNGPVILNNVPHTEDIHTMARVLRKLGAEVSWKNEAEKEQSILEIDTRSMHSTDIDPTLAGSMRASVVLTGPLLARFGKVSFPAPGGCVIGARPIDLFIDGYKKMGASVKLDTKNSIYRISAPKGLVGTDMFFNKVSVGGTETLMMAATMVKGTTTLKNCAIEPEIVNVAEWLISCGAQIEGVGTSTIVIHGANKKLLAPRTEYTTIPDRITTGSFLILGALCAEKLTIHDCNPHHVESVISLLKGSGSRITVSNTSITISNTSERIRRTSCNVMTHEYPGFPTDLQPIIATYLTQTQGESVVFETIFEGRFKYVEDLTRLGANMHVLNSREILIKGKTPFIACGTEIEKELCAHDIRAGFAVVLAALIAKGDSMIKNVHLIDRGYEQLEEVLAELGADIRRINA